MLDESSTTVAETTSEALSPADVSGPFELEADLEVGRQYAVYAHIDRSGDGTIAPGDLITTVRVPVPTRSVAEIHLDVPVQEVD